MPHPSSISRRRWLKHVGGGSAILPRLNAQTAGLQIAGRSVQIQITAVSAQTVRIAALPIEGGKAVSDDGALIRIPTAGIRTFSNGSARPVKAGDLRIQ